MVNFNLYIFFKKECDPIPKVNNSDHEVSSRKERNGVLLNGTTVTYECDDYYVTNVSTSTCGEDGKWTPAIHCVPGSLL